MCVCVFINLVDLLNIFAISVLRHRFQPPCAPSHLSLVIQAGDRLECFDNSDSETWCFASIAGLAFCELKGFSLIAILVHICPWMGKLGTGTHFYNQRKKRKCLLSNWQQAWSKQFSVARISLARLIMGGCRQGLVHSLHTPACIIITL